MSILLVTIDSVLFRKPEQYAVTVKLGQNVNKTASKEKTCSPLFNADCFMMPV